MKKLLLIAVVAGGLMVAGTTRSDAQVYFSIGFGPGYYGYYPYGLKKSFLTIGPQFSALPEYISTRPLQ